MILQYDFHNLLKKVSTVTASLKFPVEFYYAIDIIFIGDSTDFSRNAKFLSPLKLHGTHDIA